MTSRYEPTLHHRVAYDEDGYVISDADVEAWLRHLEEYGDDEDYVDEKVSSIAIVTGTAIPRSQSDDANDSHRAPGSYHSIDMVVEIDDIWEQTADEVRPRWDRMSKMVAGLNGAVPF